MVLNTVIALAVGFILLSVVATVVRLAGGRSLATLLVQTLVNIGVGYTLLTMSFISLPVAVAVIMTPLGARIFAYVWFYWQGKKILNGEYGKQTQWAAELVESGDEEFLQASAQLSQMELREVGIMSDSKKELRENTINRVQERDE